MRKSQKNASSGAGDEWTWTALDADSKLIVSYLVGGRDSEYAIVFMDDVANRLANRVQLTTDAKRHIDERAPKPGPRGPYKKDKSN